MLPKDYLKPYLLIWWLDPHGPDEVESIVCIVVSEAVRVRKPVRPISVCLERTSSATCVAIFVIGCRHLKFLAHRLCYFFLTWCEFLLSNIVNERGYIYKIVGICVYPLVDLINDQLFQRTYLYIFKGRSLRVVWWRKVGVRWRKVQRLNTPARLLEVSIRLKNLLRIKISLCYKSPDFINKKTLIIRHV